MRRARRACSTTKAGNWPRCLAIATDDGDPDLFIANDRQPNFLFLNNGDGTFAEHGIIAGVAYNEEGYAESAMGADFGDYDNDGRLDIILATFQWLPNTLYHNRWRGDFFSRP